MRETAGVKHVTAVNTIGCVSPNRVGHSWDSRGTPTGHSVMSYAFRSETACVCAAHSFRVFEKTFCNIYNYRFVCGVFINAKSKQFQQIYTRCQAHGPGFRVHETSRFGAYCADAAVQFVVRVLQRIRQDERSRGDRNDACADRQAR